MGSKLKVFGGQNNNMDVTKPYWLLKIKNNKIKYNTENTAVGLGYAQKQNRKKKINM